MERWPSDVNIRCCYKYHSRHVVRVRIRRGRVPPSRSPAQNGGPSRGVGSSEPGGGKTNMTCKNICLRHKAQKPVGFGRYFTGQKRCQICEIFIIWPGLWCPCCGYRLRTKPRNLKYKAKLRNRARMQTAKQVLDLHHPLQDNNEGKTLPGSYQIASQKIRLEERRK